VIRIFYKLFLGCSIYILLVASVGLPIEAVGLFSWLPAKYIPLYDDEYPPFLVADQNRTVHAFNSQQMENGDVAILYRTWSVEMGWSLPVDVLLPNTIRFALQGVFLDDAGVFHMVYFRENRPGHGEFLYSKALALEAMNAHSWSVPVIIAEEAGPMNSAWLVGNGKEHLTLVYAGQKLGMGIYEVQSNDAGATWSDSAPVAFVYDPDNYPTHIRGTLDPSGRLHMVWSTVGSRGFGEKVYYSRREEDGVSWTEPTILAAREGLDYAADWASIIYYQDELIVMYMDGMPVVGIPPTRWMRRSNDGGQSWTSPVKPFPQVGENGYAELLVDSKNTLHILLANRVGDPPVGGMWYGRWLGSRWSELELVTASSAEQAITMGSYSEVGGASRPNAVVSQGNVILAAWWHDTSTPDVPAGYTFTYLDAPELPLVPFPTPEVEVTPELPSHDPEFQEVLTATPTNNIVGNTQIDLSPPVNNNPLGLMIQGVVPAFLILIFITFLHNRSRRK
jgi:hypothetical protein